MSRARLADSVFPLISCVVCVAVLFLYAGFRGELSPWWRGHAGGIPYVMFWVFLWLIFLPDRKWLVPICIGCVLLTCGLEFFQLVKGPVWLDQFRMTRFGAAWLGRGFDWLDLPPYFLGGGLAWLIGWLGLSRLE